MHAILSWAAAHYEVLKDFAAPAATVLAAGVALTAAVVAALIALHFGRVQARLARNQAETAKQQADLALVRLKHDLFDRRYEVYDLARSALGEISRDGNISPERLAGLVGAAGKAVFIFPQPVVDYLTELFQKGFELRHYKHQASTDPNASQQATELMGWFRQQYDIMLNMFRDYMALDENTATKAPPPQRQ